MDIMNQTIDLLVEARAMQAELVAIRQAVHANPELSFAEVETGKLIAKKLEQIGFKISDPIAGTGFYADYGSGKRVAIRCDMDALPIDELNNVTYRSSKAGIMHACGHDAHVAMVLAAAQLFVKNAKGGALRILLQPGEEKADESGRKGATYLLEAGALDGVYAVLGMHVDPTVDVGQVAVLNEAIAQSHDHFLVTAGGDTSDGDTVALMVHVLQELESIQTEHVGGIRFKINSAAASNDASKDMRISGLISYRSEQSSSEVKKQLVAMIAGLEPAVCAIEIKSDAEHFQRQESVRASLQQCAAQILGEKNVLAVKRRSWLEQFAELTQTTPGAFFLVGSRLQGSIRTQHSATFDIDELSLPIGAAVLAQAALKLSGAS